MIRSSLKQNAVNIEYNRQTHTVQRLLWRQYDIESNSFKKEIKSDRL